MRVTVGIPTKNRSDTLAMTLMSLALQTVKDFDLIIVDDSDTQIDLRDIPIFQHIFPLLTHHGINWQVVWGSKRGQHYSHQLIQEMAKTEWIWRVDDDECLEPDCLVRLRSHIRTDVGAVGGLVLPPQPSWVPDNAANLISDLNLPNLQWFLPADELQGGPPVEHLHSTFMYRKGVAKYELGLSPAAHREETIFTYEIKRAGYQLLIDPTAITWHFRAGHGGIRSHEDVRYWEEDEKLFEDKLREWGVKGERSKTIVVDGGLGDQIVLKSLIPKLKEKYGKLVIACCNPAVFAEDKVELISIAEAKQRLGNIDRFNVYRFMIDNAWTGSLQSAFSGLY